MSTRETIWRSEGQHGKGVHLYFELAERQQIEGNGIALPVYLAIDGRDSEGAPAEKAFRLSKEVGEAVVALLAAEGRKGLRVLCCVCEGCKVDLALGRA